MRESATSRPVVLAALLGVLVFGASAASALDPVVCIDENQFVQPPLAPAVVPLGVSGGGEVYEGASPPGLDPSKPVLVFVHGLHGNVASWNGDTEYYGHNDMYDTAYAAGYKTFFVDLWDAEGEAKNSITNGKLLVKLVRTITQYWGVDQVNVVAHSKGGVDANVAALLSKGLIDSVFTLSSPHWGSPLADLAQSSSLEWLADLLGFNDEGTKFLQTACMAWFRSAIDWRPANDNYAVHTAAATGWGPLFSSLEYGGLYLATVCPGGDNDGLVCVEHAEHPWGRDAGGTVTGEHRLVWDAGGPDFEADHDNVRMGNAFMDFTWFWEPDDCYIPIFGSIEPYVGGFHNGPEPVSRPVLSPATADSRALHSLLRGGPIGADGAAIEFPVEPGVGRFAVRVLLGPAPSRVVLRSPSGGTFELPAATPSGGRIFRGTSVTGLEVDRPEAGAWRLELTSEGPNAFALLGVFDSDLEVRLSVAPDGATGRVVSVAVDGAGAVEVSGVLKGAGGQRRELAGDAGVLAFTPGPGEVHNLSLTIRGALAGGEAFERSAVVPIVVGGGPSGGPGGAKLPEFCE